MLIEDTGTPQVETPQVESPAPTIEMPDPPAPEPVNLFDPDAAPAWVNEFTGDGEDGGFDLTPERLEGLSTEAKMAIRAVVRDARAARDEAAAARAQLAEKAKGVESDANQLAAERAALYKRLFQSDAVQSALKGPQLGEGEEEPDLFTREGIVHHVQAEAAKANREFVEAIMKQIASLEEEGAQAEAAQAEQAELEAIGKFMDEHDDFMTYADRIEELTNIGLNHDKAYLLAKAEAGNLTQGEVSDPMDEALSRSRRFGSSRPVTTRSEAEIPDFGNDAIAAALWLEKHPDLQERVIRRKGKL